MKTVADLFATTGAEFVHDPRSDRHFLLVTRLPADTPESGCTYVKSVTPGMLQNEYWISREKNLLMLLKKLPQIARLRKDDDPGETGYHTVRTRDAGLSLDYWLQMRARSAAGADLPHPFAPVNAFLQLTRGALTALRGIHKEGIVHAGVNPENLCLPYAPYPCELSQGVLPDYANLTLIDFMFSVSNTLRLYRHLPVTPLAAPSYHSTQFRLALETDRLNQRAELIQEIDYSADLYALGHLLEELFQKGLIYPANMQSQMEMTIYNLIQELLGYDDGIPPGSQQKYGGGMPHDTFIKRIDNMLAMDPKSGDPDGYRLHPDPDQSLQEPVDAPPPLSADYLEPHEPPAGEPTPASEPILHTESLLVTESLPPRTAAPVERPTGFLEISAPVVILMVVLLQAGAFIYQEGDRLNLDIALSLLLMIAIGGGTALLALLVLPRNKLYHFSEPDTAEIAAWEQQEQEVHAEKARLAALEPDSSVEFNKFAVISLIVSGQLSWLMYTEGDRVNLDIPMSLLLTLTLGIGLAIVLQVYEKLTTVKPIPTFDDEDETAETETADLPMMTAGAAGGVAAAVKSEDDAPVATLTEAMPMADDAAETAPAVNAFSQAHSEERHEPQDEPLPVIPVVVPGESVFERMDAPQPEPIPEPAAAPVLPETPTGSAADEVAAAKPAEEKYWEFDKKLIILLLLLFLGLITYLTLPEKTPSAPTAAQPAPVPAPPPAPVAQEPVLPPVEDVPSVPETQPQVELPASAPKEAHMAAPKARVAKPKTAKAAAEAPEAAAAETPTTATAGATKPAAATAAEPAAAEKPAAAKPAEPVAAEAKPVLEAPPRPLGNPLGQAENVMGWYYFKGISVKKDVGEAVKHFRKAAELGDPSGQFNLGLMYSSGNGVGVNLAEAAKWYKQSAAQGKASAQLNLGLMYLSGRGVPQNTAEGTRLLKLAADQGDATAQSTLDSLNKTQAAPAPAPSAP